jgi:hypothetical protein
LGLAPVLRAANHRQRLLRGRDRDAAECARGVPPHSVDPLVTQQGLLGKVANARWTTETAQDGAGVTFDEFIADTRASLEAYGLVANLDIFKPQDDSAATLAELRRLLIENELSDRDIVLVYFDQGVLTGDWDGPHISPIATYDVDLRHVLIMDVDRQWYITYWSSDELKLVECGGTRLHRRLSRNAERAARSQNQFESIKARRLSRPAPRLATAAGTTDATASRQPHSSHSS